jgi:hypothetical protein
MPKLRTYSFQYRTKTTLEDFEITVHVSRDGDFYFHKEEVPACIRSVVDGGTYFGNKRNGSFESYEADALKDIPKGVEKMIEQYHDTLAENEEVKVIKYKFELTGPKTAPRPDILDQDGSPVAMEYFSRNTWSGRNENLSMSFSWQVLQRITRKTSQASRFRSDGAVYVASDGEKVSVYEDDKVVDWTPEREAWFKRTEESMRGLMLNVEAFTKLDDDRLHAVIDGSNNLISFAPGGDK